MVEHAPDLAELVSSVDPLLQREADLQQEKDELVARHEREQEQHKLEEGKLTTELTRVGEAIRHQSANLVIDRKIRIETGEPDCKIVQGFYVGEMDRSQADTPEGNEGILVGMGRERRDGAFMAVIQVGSELYLYDVMSNEFTLGEFAAPSEISEKVWHIRQRKGDRHDWFRN